jgi:hypothetical protein
MTIAHDFVVIRRDLDGYPGALTIDVLEAPTVTARSFDEAREELVAELRRLLAAAERLEEPTP